MQRQIYGRMARISRPKLKGLGSHEGVLLPSGMVLHLTQERGICLVTQQDFAQGHVLKFELELPPERHPEAMLRLNTLLWENRPYDLILNNCEMFARRAVLQPPESPQVILWAVATILVTWWAASSQA